MADTVYSELNILDRGLFDLMPDANKTNNIFFVREGTKETAKILSLYLGTKKQCDILDITSDVTFFLNEPVIPDKYKVQNKIFLIKKVISDQFGNAETRYLAYMWNGEQFYECFGSINNVIVCDALPASNMVKGFIYVTIQNPAMYVWDGNSYIDIMSNNEYATKEYVNGIYNTLLDIIASINTGVTMIGTVISVVRSTKDELFGFVENVTT